MDHRDGVMPLGAGPGGPTVEKKRRPARRGVRLLFLLILIGLFVGYLWRSRPPSDRITVSEVVDATEVNVSSKVAGTLAAVLVGEGDSVYAGQLLARLDDARIQDQVAARATRAMMRTRAPQAAVMLLLGTLLFKRTLE